MNLQDNSGILPIHWKESKIRSKYLDFIHFNDLKSIFKEFEHLQKQYSAVKGLFLNKPESIHQKDLESHWRISEYQLNMADQKLK